MTIPDVGYWELKHSKRIQVLGINYDAIGELLFLRFFLGKYKENKLVKSFKLLFKYDYIPLSLDRKLEVLDNLIANKVISIKNFKKIRDDIVENREQYDIAYKFLLTGVKPSFEPKEWELDVNILKKEEAIKQEYEKAIEEFEIEIDHVSLEKQKKIVSASLKDRKEYLGKKKMTFGYGHIFEEAKGEINLFYILLSLEKNLKISIASLNYEHFTWEVELNAKYFDKIEDSRIKRIDFPADIKWSDISIRFINGADVDVEVKGHPYTLNYKDMGFEDKRKRMPNEQWKFLEALSGLNGEVAWQDSIADDKLKKKKQKLSDSLKVFFNIDEDPFEDYRKEKMYRIKIHLYLDK